jgi:putative membrane protein
VAGDSTFSRVLFYPAPERVADGEEHGSFGIVSPVSIEEDDHEPDVRFTFANERTFLAWSRTALALVVAGLGVVQLLPPFPGVPWGRHLLGVPLIVFGAIVAIAAHAEWQRNQRALRRGAPLPASLLPKILAVVIAVMAVIASVVLLLSAVR